MRIGFLYTLASNEWLLKDSATCRFVDCFSTEWRSIKGVHNYHQQALTFFKMANNQPPPTSGSSTGSDDESCVQESSSGSESPGWEVQHQDSDNANTNIGQQRWWMGCWYFMWWCWSCRWQTCRIEGRSNQEGKCQKACSIACKISGYKCRKKDLFCDLIVNKKKSRSIVSVIYSKDNSSSDSEEGEKSSTKPKTTKTKGSAPDAMHHKGNFLLSHSKCLLPWEA